MSPSVGLCCAAHLLCCLQQTRLEFRQACSHRYIATLIASPTQSLKSMYTVLNEFSSVHLMTLLNGDVKFTSDMILELLENFDKGYQGDLNSFKEG